MRWAIVAGTIEPGAGPATERTGPAFLAARELLDTARASREGLLVRVGEERADALLAGLAPLLGGPARRSDRSAAFDRPADARRGPPPVRGRRAARREPCHDLRHGRAGAHPAHRRAPRRSAPARPGCGRGRERGRTVTADAGLVLAWLVLAHLVADFVLQPGRMARAKAAPGSGATPALLAHALVVGVCVVPFGLAFGVAGLVGRGDHHVQPRGHRPAQVGVDAGVRRPRHWPRHADGTRQRAPHRTVSVRRGRPCPERCSRVDQARPRRDPRRRLGGPALGGATRSGLCRLGGRLARGQGSRGRPRSALPRRRPREPPDRQRPSRGAVRGRPRRASTGDGRASAGGSPGRAGRARLRRLPRRGSAGRSRSDRSRDGPSRIPPARRRRP